MLLCAVMEGWAWAWACRGWGGGGWDVEMHLWVIVD